MRGKIGKLPVRARTGIGAGAGGSAVVGVVVDHVVHQKDQKDPVGQPLGRAGVAVAAHGSLLAPGGSGSIGPAWADGDYTISHYRDLVKRKLAICAKIKGYNPSQPPLNLRGGECLDGLLIKTLDWNWRAG